MCAPAYIDVRHILLGFPVLRIQQKINARAVGSRRITKHAVRRASPRIIRRYSRSLQGLAVLVYMLSYEVILITFIKLCHHKNSIIHKLSNLRQRITEQTAYARCHVYARTLKLILWNDLKSNHAQAASLPYRADTQKIEKFRYILSAASHVRA